MCFLLMLKRTRSSRQVGRCSQHTTGWLWIRWPVVSSGGPYDPNITPFIICCEVLRRTAVAPNVLGL